MCQSTDFLFCLCYVMYVQHTTGKHLFLPGPFCCSGAGRLDSASGLHLWLGGGDCASYFQRNHRPAKILGKCVLAPSLNATQRARSSASLVYRAGCAPACSLNACVLPQNVALRTGPQGVGEEALSEHSFPLGEKK